MKHTGREQTKKQPKPLGKQYLVPAIKRSFDVIDLLAQRNTGMTVSEIHTLTCRLASAAAILYTLQILGYIDKDPQSARYMLGLKLYSFSRRLVDQLDLPGRCHGLWAELAAETGFTSHIAVMRDGESMYVDRVPGSGLIQFSSYIGMRWALHASGVGKALLAFLARGRTGANIEVYSADQDHPLHHHFAVAAGKTVAAISPLRVRLGNQ